MSLCIITHGILNTCSDKKCLGIKGSQQVNFRGLLCHMWKWWRWCNFDLPSLLHVLLIQWSNYCSTVESGMGWDFPIQWLPNWALTGNNWRTNEKNSPKIEIWTLSLFNVSFRVIIDFVTVCIFRVEPFFNIHLYFCSGMKKNKSSGRSVSPRPIIQLIFFCRA